MVLIVPRRVEVRAFTKDLQLAGVVVGRSSDALSASFTVNYNGVGTGNVTLPIDHPLVATLLEPGMRLQFRYLYDVPILQLSGPIVATSAGLDARTATITYTCVGDDQILQNLGWPKPDAPLSGQTDEYYTRSGAIDGQVNSIVLDNLITRLGLNVKLVPLFADAGTGTIKSRFHTIAEVIYPALESANRGIRLFQWNPGDEKPFFLSGPGQLEQACILAEIYKPEDKPWITWTPVLGLNSGTASTSAPKVTRVVIGGQGEGTARTFEGYPDAALEAQWGSLHLRETFVDARDEADAATRATRAAEALAAGQPSGGLTVTCVDGDPWTVGNDYNLGDRVRIAAITGEVISTETVRAITVTTTPGEGPQVTPQIGDPSATSDPDQALARIIRDLGSRISALESRR